MEIHEGPFDIVRGDRVQLPRRNNKRCKMKFRNAHNKRDCKMCESNNLHSTRKREAQFKEHDGSGSNRKAF